MRAKRAKWAKNFWGVGRVSDKRRMSGDAGQGRKRGKRRTDRETSGEKGGRGGREMVRSQLNEGKNQVRELAFGGLGGGEAESVGKRRGQVEVHGGEEPATPLPSSSLNSRRKL